MEANFLGGLEGANLGTPRFAGGVEKVCRTVDGCITH